MRYRIEAEWRDVEEQYAAQLRAVSHDAIRDDDLYRRTHLAQRTADRASALTFSPLAPIGAVAGATSTILRVGFKVGYDEGAWTEILTGILLNRIKWVGKVLKLGAKALPRNGMAREGLMGARERSLIGVREAARDSLWFKRAGNAADDTPKFVNPPLSGSLVKDTLAKARARASNELEKRYLADFRIATRNGSVAKRMLLTSWAADGTVRVVAGVQKGTAVQEKYRAWQEDRREEERVR